MQRTCRMEGTAVAVFGNNLTQTWGLNNLLKVIQIIIRLWGNQKCKGQTCRNEEKDDFG